MFQIFNRNTCVLVTLRKKKIINSLWCFITFMNCDSVGVAAGIKFDFDLIALKWRQFGSLLVQSAFILLVLIPASAIANSGLQ